MQAKLLLIDDDPLILKLLNETFADRDFQIFQATESQAGLKIIHEQRPNVAIIDIMLPDKSGLELLREIKQIDLGITVIMTTGQNTTRNAIDAMRLGAYDYLTKPFSIKTLTDIVDKGIASNLLSRKVRYTREQKDLENQVPGEDVMVGSSPEMVEIWKMVGRAAESEATTLIQGESGTGKELLARAIYNNSSRRNRLFLAINCAALPETLLESELFGHERGAFTDAHSRRIGKFEQCNGGTLFLDEISEMSLASQGKLLRVLEKQSFQRLGGNEEIHTDVRIIAAANRNLLEMVREKKFRMDLFYRLHVINFSLPPLRERREDIPLLVDLFVRQWVRRNKKNINVPPVTLEFLAAREWEGNIRELKNAINAALVFSTDGVLKPEDFAACDFPEAHGEPQERTVAGLPDVFKDELRKRFPDWCHHHAGAILPTISDDLEKTMIDLALERCLNNQVAAARLLGISRNTLRKKLSGPS